MAAFIECTSVNVSYDRMGLATVSWTVVHTGAQLTTLAGSSMSFGTNSFQGYVTNASMNAIPDAEGWYETNVSYISVAN